MTAPDRAADFRGLLCPLPTVKTALLLEELPAGAVVEILADDPVTRRDLPGWAREMGHAVLEEKEEAGACRFLIRKGTP